MPGEAGGDGLFVLAGLDVVMAAIHPDAIRDPRLALVLFTWVAACGVLGDSAGGCPRRCDWASVCHGDLHPGGARHHSDRSQLDAISMLGHWLATAAVVLWACGAAWIPYLLVLELARARISGLSLRSDHGRWSTVFPLGMFSVATFELDSHFGLPVLGTIAGIAFWVGLALALLNLGRAAGSLAGAPKRFC